MTTPPGSHRRFNPLLEEWVLCSPGRLGRPWQGQNEPPAAETLPRYDPDCYLCPGNVRANGERNPDYAGTFAFDNDFPSLDAHAYDQETEPADELLRAVSESGVCRVLCFSPRHDLTLARMDHAGIRGVVDAWAEEVARLSEREGIRHVQVFENKGAMMGCSNPHPHCQVWATEHLPTGPARRLASQERYLAEHGRDLLGDYLARELAEEERIVCKNTHWIAVVPFWAVWPFETLIVPLRRVGDIPGLEDDERDALADLLGRLGRRYDNLFRCSFPYSMGWHGQPVDGGAHPYWRLHASFLPPLLRSATVRKFVVGYELAAEPQRDLTPEEAADRLRAASEVHDLDDDEPVRLDPAAFRR
jgi:UDPglucose--hexose-1-phosphate uridylyltransferase